jgi:hypothetical protein
MDPEILAVSRSGVIFLDRGNFFPEKCQEKYLHKKNSYS